MVERMSEVFKVIGVRLKLVVSIMNLLMEVDEFDILVMWIFL